MVALAKSQVPLADRLKKMGIEGDYAAMIKRIIGGKRASRTIRPQDEAIVSELSSLGYVDIWEVGTIARRVTLSAVCQAKIQYRLDGEPPKWRPLTKRERKAKLTSRMKAETLAKTRLVFTTDIGVHDNSEIASTLEWLASAGNSFGVGDFTLDAAHGVLTMASLQGSSVIA